MYNYNIIFLCLVVDSIQIQNYYFINIIIIQIPITKMKKFRTDNIILLFRVDATFRISTKHNIKICTKISWGLRFLYYFIIESKYLLS